STVATRLRPLRHVASAHCVRARFLAAAASPLPASDELSCPRCGATDPDIIALPPRPSWQMVRPAVPARFSSRYSSDPATALRQPRFAGHVCALLPSRNLPVVAAACSPFHGPPPETPPGARRVAGAGLSAGAQPSSGAWHSGARCPLQTSLCL